MRGIEWEEKKNTPRINEVMGNLKMFKAKAGENHPITICIL